MERVMILMSFVSTNNIKFINMKRVLLLLMCFVALSASAQGAFGRCAAKGLKKVSHYKYPIAGGTAHQLKLANQNRYLYQHRAAPLYQYGYTHSVPSDPDASQSTMTKSGKDVESEVKGEVVLGLIEENGIMDENKSTNVVSDKQTESEEEFNTIVKIVFVFVGLLSFCVICILIASFLEKKKTKTSTNIIWNDRNVCARHDKRDCMYLPQGAGFLVRT